MSPAGPAVAPHGRAHGPCILAPLPGTVGALWACVEAEWVAGHRRWQKAAEHATEAQVALYDLLTQLIKGQVRNHLLLVGHAGDSGLHGYCPGAGGCAPRVAGGAAGGDQWPAVPVAAPGWCCGGSSSSTTHDLRRGSWPSQWAMPEPCQPPTVAARLPCPLAAVALLWATQNKGCFHTLRWHDYFCCIAARGSQPVQLPVALASFWVDYPWVSQ